MSISILLLLFLYGAAVAMLGIAFQFMQQEGQIFEFYRNWLIRNIELSMKPGRPIYGCSTGLVIGYKKQHFIIRLIAYLSKPLGLCVYCNTTWVAIIAYIILFGLNIYILLFIGIIFFFVRLLYEFNFHKYTDK